MKPRRDAPGRRSAAPPRSPPPAMRPEARDRAPQPAANRVRSAPIVPDVQARSLTGTLRMAQLHPPVKCGDPAIAGRLVEHRIALHRGGEGFRVALLLDLEGVEAGAQHEYELVAQHLTGGAQLAFESMALPQQPRLAVGTAVAEGRKYQRNRREPAEMGHEIVNVAVVRPDHGSPPGAARKCFGISKKSRGGDQDGALAGNIGLVGHMDQRIGCDFAAFNEWHRRAP